MVEVDERELIRELKLELLAGLARQEALSSDLQDQVDQLVALLKEVLAGRGPMYVSSDVVDVLDEVEQAVQASNDYYYSTN